jgi:transposase-like protein
VIYLDALVVKVRDGAHVKNKAAHIAIGVDMDGIKHVLGIWVQATEGAKFWAGVCAQLANRGVSDVLIVCCDGLTGFPEAIEATWPDSIVQTCVVHLIRAAMRFVAYKSRKAVAQALKPIYQAADEDAARAALTEFSGTELGQANPNTIRVFEDAWDRFTPFLAFPPMLRRVIYTTNSIESLNFQLRKIIKNRGHFPNDDAVVKLLWLAIGNIEDKRARQREKEKGGTRENETQSRRQTHRRANHHQLATSTRPTRPRIPRTNQPLPITTKHTPYTKHLTSSQGKRTGALARGYRPAHDAPGVRVGDERHIGETSGCKAHVRDVGHVQAARSVGREAALHEVLAPRRGF